MNRREMLKNSVQSLAIVGAPVGGTVVIKGEGRFERLRREGRRRNLQVSPEFLQTVLGGWAMREFQHIALPTFKNLPTDIILEGVHYSEWNRNFLLHLWHESFDPVPDGAETPSLEGGNWSYFTLRRVSDLYKMPKTNW